MRRALITFWALVALAVLAVGGVSKALAAPAGVATGIAFLAAATVAVIASLLAGRILLVISRR